MTTPAPLDFATILAHVQTTGSFAFGNYPSARIAAREFREWAAERGVTIYLAWGANAGGCLATIA
jgi:hypothetical protein